MIAFMENGDHEPKTPREKLLLRFVFWGTTIAVGTLWSLYVRAK
jgi:hypothetical protein